MTVTDLVAECVRRDILLWPISPDRVRCMAPPGSLTDDLKCALVALKPALWRELAWRVAAMRRQLPPSPRPIPPLAARPGLRPTPGACWSCGQRLSRETPWHQRCVLCVAAAQLVVFHAPAAVAG